MDELLRVLLVEDDKFDQFAFKRFVEGERLPYEAIIAGSVLEARSLLDEHDFDIALIDYRLGANTAFDLLETIEETPSIIITGAGDEEIAVKAMRAGAYDYLVKDIEGRHLKTLPLVVDRAIRRKRAEDELELYRQSLETLVEERTVELIRANQKLSTEIAERERVEAQIRLLASALESAANSIAITNAQGVILWVNPAFTKLTGYIYDEVVGKTFRILKSGFQDEAFYRDLWETILAGKSWHGELINLNKDSSPYHEEMTITPVRDANEAVINFIAIKQDVSDRVEVKRQLEYLASHDMVTGLPNRLLFNDRLSHALTLSKRHKNQGAVLFLDLDDFKAVNDAFSHEDGDRLLHVLAKRLTNCLRESDTVARIGGDEFAILLEEIFNPEDAAYIAQKLIQVVSSPLSVRDNEVFITGSIGISIFPDDGRDITTLLQNADAAMYRAKEQGKNTYRYYTPEMTTRILERLNLANHLWRALERDDLFLRYQPQVDARNGKIIGIEALLRLRHPDRGVIPPNEFIPLAENNGTIIEIGEWVLHEVCTLNKAWQDAGLPRIRSAVNMSERQLRQTDLADTIKQVLDDTGLDPGLLELEISENIAFQETEKTIEVLQNLKELGVKLAIDDFGTGYSSLSHLARFPLDTMKIDLSFTQSVTTDPNAVAVVSGMIAIANSLGLVIVVEGVETAEQFEFFKSYGCNLIQGYYFSPAVSAEDVEKLLREGIPEYLQLYPSI